MNAKLKATKLKKVSAKLPAVKTKAATASTNGATKKPKMKKVGSEKKHKRISALDAAAQMLAKSGKPMRARELITAMGDQGLWKSPTGKTPHATLYAAILREISTKGSQARFKKIDRGQFQFNG